MHILPAIFIPIFFVCFVALWFTITSQLATKSGFSKSQKPILTTPLKQSLYGTAYVNNIRWKNALKIVEYPDGWLLRTMPLFGRATLRSSQSRTTPKTS